VRGVRLSAEAIDELVAAAGWPSPPVRTGVRVPLGGRSHPASEAGSPGAFSRLRDNLRAADRVEGDPGVEGVRGWGPSS
jgi:hypothetical protein